MDNGVRPHVILEEAAEGTEVTTPDGAHAYVIERPLVGPEGEWNGPVFNAPPNGPNDLCRSFDEVLARKDSGLRAQLAYIGAPEDLRPQDLLFFDLETTGLVSSPLFLIGTMVREESGLVVRQFFARDYSEERAVLSLFFRLAEERRLLVSFNGKTFDQPFVRTRAAANGIFGPFDPPHLDLLHVARRTWKDRLPNCKLQTLERYVCRRLRHDDIPGHLIPDAYHAYVRSGNAVRMVEVLQHNLLDLITMADLMVRLPPIGP